MNSMPITLVPDPTHTGRGSAPLMVKADAMRKLFKSGKSVVEVALFFRVSYHNAYKTINPPRSRARQAASSPGSASSSASSSAPKSTDVKPLTKERLTQLTKRRLIEIATTKGKTPAELQRIEAAAAELDRRDPSWLDSL